MAAIDRNKYVLRKLSERQGHAMTPFKRSGPVYRATCKRDGCAAYAEVTDGRYPLEGTATDARCPIREG